MRQNEFNSIVDALNNYIPRIQKSNEAKNSLLNNVKNIYEGREKIIKDFKKGVLSLKSDYYYYDDDDDDDDDESKQQTSKKKQKQLM